MAPMKVAVVPTDAKAPMKLVKQTQQKRKSISKVVTALIVKTQVKKGAVTTADAKAPVKPVKQPLLKKQLVSKMAKNMSKAQAKRKAKDTAGEEPESKTIKGKAATVKKSVKAAQAPTVESEEQIKLARTKELKAMAAVDLKALLESKDLPTGKKEDMIATLLKAETKVRAEVRAHEAKVKVVVDEIQKSLDAKSSPELKELCASKGLKVGGDMNERIQRLLQLSKESGEIEKIMAQNARNARREVLSALDKPALLKHCEKAKIDPLVQEVMVERLYSHEVATGGIRLFKAEEFDKKVDKAKLDKKLVQLKAMEVGELKKLAETNGFEAGKKEVMIQALLAQTVAAEAGAARKKELKALGKDGLKELAASYSLPAGNSQAMIESLLAHDAKIYESAQRQKGMVKDLEAKKVEEFSSKSASELKELCSAKSLKLGGGKEERVERLLQAARDAGEMDQVLLAMAQAARREELNKFDKTSLKALCDKAGIDTIIKEVLVERVVAREFDVPAAKKQRVA